jgi:oligopeptide/dipeptide ABC transporter ATP-binding protein
MTVEQIVAEPLELHRRELDAAQRARAVAAMLADVGLDAEHARRFPHELSGGQCQRVAIARAMILQPRLLLCDEPVAALDLTTQQHILDLLAAVRGRRGTALLVVTHNLAAVRRLCEHVLVLYLGRAMECAPTHTLLERPLHPYTRALLEAAPIADPQRQRVRLAHVLEGEPPSVATPPSGCVFRTRCPHALALCAERVPAWEEAAPDHFVACHRAAELSGRSGGPEPVWPASQPSREPASADAATTRTRYPRLDEEGT